MWQICPQTYNIIQNYMRVEKTFKNKQYVKAMRAR
jgi:hypothetical protein